MDFPRVVILEGDWFLLLDPFILGLEHVSDFSLVSHNKRHIMHRDPQLNLKWTRHILEPMTEKKGWHLNCCVPIVNTV